MDSRRGKQNPGAPPQENSWWARGWRLMHSGGSAGWLITTVLQALLTWGFIGVARLAEGFPWERQAKMLVVVAVVATWCMALRTIRARLLELFRLLRKGKEAIVEKAARSARAAIPARLRVLQEVYVHKSVFRLRLIAAGLTMPFFVLPIFVAALCVGLCWRQAQQNTGELLGMAMVLSLMSIAVGAFFYWTVEPNPVRARVRVQSTRMRRPR